MLSMHTDLIVHRLRRERDDGTSGVGKKDATFPQLIPLRRVVKTDQHRILRLPGRAGRSSSDLEVARPGGSLRRQHTEHGEPLSVGRLDEIRNEMRQPFERLARPDRADEAEAVALQFERGERQMR